LASGKAGGLLKRIIR